MPPLNLKNPANPSRSDPIRPAGVSKGIKSEFQKILLYSPGGCGKTELCSLLPQVGIEPLFIDVEDGSKFLDVARIDPVPQTWEEVRAIFHNRELLEQFGGVVIDSLTKLEEMAVAWTIENVKHEKGHKATSVEGYGFGKGFSHVFETFLQILGDLDAVSRMGKQVVLTAHDCTNNVPNPAGENFIRYEPRLQAPPSGKGSIRNRVIEWADHVLFINYDSIVTDGKAIGSGTRTIYPIALPQHWAKSRTLSSEIAYKKGDAELWRQLFKKGN
jgi:hypothetical protein